jgi:hypothetical protein
LTWGDQLLDALDYLHTQDPQIIHRDIKPQNLKLTGRGQIILLDFGLAKGQTAGVSMVTTSASIFGYTPNYAPLEQIQGLGTDARSDIYALSATLYHLMTAVKPPDALTRAAALVNGQPDPLAPANQITVSVGPEVAGVLARAMSQNKEQRFPSAAGMRAALKGTGEAGTLLGKTEAATVLFDSTGATVAAAPDTKARQTTARAGETTVVRSQAAARKRRVAPWAIGAAAVILIGVLFGGFYAYQHRNNLNAATAPSNSAEQGNVNSANTQPSPALHQTATEPASGAVEDAKKIVISTHPTPVNEPVKKNEKAARNNEKVGEKPATVGAVEVPTQADEQYVPVPPEVTVPDISRPDRRGLRRMGGVTTRNFPDGRQIMTLPDGTRVMTMPDGTRRVLRPGEKMMRKKGLP